jgi:pimeloyl-ACP methyl ester carboxylesterase
MSEFACQTVESSDGTLIAYEVAGRGPALVVVTGAFNDRRTGAGLAAALSNRFSVYTYDRRGRGDSSDTLHYAVEREIDDLAAVIQAAGGTASVFGFSSGAALALKAAAVLPIDRLILFGPPIATGAGRPPVPKDLAERVEALVDRGERGEAVELFQREGIGIPPAVVEKLRRAPFRPALEALAHTLPYDLAVTAAPAGLAPLLADVEMRTLVLDGTEGPAWIRDTAKVVAAGLTNATHVSIEGLGQDLDPDQIAPLIADFLAA